MAWRGVLLLRLILYISFFWWNLVSIFIKVIFHFFILCCVIPFFIIQALILSYMLSRVTLTSMLRHRKWTKAAMPMWWTDESNIIMDASPLVVVIRNYALLFDICRGWIGDISIVLVEMSVRVSNGPVDTGEMMKLMICWASWHKFF